MRSSVALTFAYSSILATGMSAIFLALHLSYHLCRLADLVANLQRLILMRGEVALLRRLK